MVRQNDSSSRGLRLPHAVIAAACAALLVSAFECVRQESALGGGADWLTLLGLDLPLFLLLGAVTGCLLCVLDLGPRWGLWSLVEWDKLPIKERQRLSARALLYPLAGLGAALLLGRLNLSLLTLELSSGFVTLAAGTAFGLGLLGLGVALERVCRGPAIAVFGQRSPLWALGIGLGSALGLLLLLVQLGNTAGAGGLLGMWGVLRREELDLRLPAYLLTGVIFSYQLPVLFGRLRLAVTLGTLSGVLLAAAGLLWRAERATHDPVLGLELERQTALAGRTLQLGRKLTDRDGDGFAGHFGGGDCDDGRAELNPDAQEIRGNGIDEDCSGADLTEPLPSAPTHDSPTSREPPPSSVLSAVPSANALLAPDLNVLFVTVDTLRHDLGFMGYSRPISPNIDRLAQRSTVYERAYALASYTSKSLAPLLIGRYGSETHRGWMHFNRYPAEDVMLQERIQKQGIKTLSIQGHWYFDVKSGIGRGFDILDLSASPKEDQAEGDKTVNSVELTNAAITHLQQLGSSQRFYMWVHYLDPHAEYVAHPEFTFGKNQRALYDGEVAFTDAQVGRLLGELEKLPFAARTAIVFTSDHGEAFSEHGMVRHGFELWEELVRVPLIIYVPGQAPRRYTARRSAIDLVPTLLQLLSLPAANDKSQADALPGTSLVPELIGAPKADLPARPIFIDMPAGPFNGDRQALIQDDLKVITSNSKPVGLYDLKTDPGEQTNLVRDGARASAALDAFKAFRSQLRTVVVKPR